MTDLYYKNLYNDLYKAGYHKGNAFAGRHLMKFLEKYYTVNKNDVALDIGCSNGTGISKINNLAGSNICYGMDPADLAIKYCNERYPNSTEKYKVAALPNIPFDDGMFNIIFCSDVLEHLLPADVEKTIHEIIRVSAAVTHIFLDIALVPESNRYNKIYETHKVKNLHTNLLSSEEWFEIFANAGLEVQEYIIWNEVEGKIINNIDYSNKEGALHIYLKKI